MPKRDFYLFFLFFLCKETFIMMPNLILRVITDLNIRQNSFLCKNTFKLDDNLRLFHSNFLLFSRISLKILSMFFKLTRFL